MKKFQDVSSKICQNNVNQKLVFCSVVLVFVFLKTLSYSLNLTGLKLAGSACLCLPSSLGLCHHAQHSTIVFVFLHIIFTRVKLMYYSAMCGDSGMKF